MGYLYEIVTMPHTPQYIHEALKQSANELNTTHHDLINAILAEWL
ncbi:hypothetical protein [Synechocystis sp. PCC 7509]|nr:hypothetical protein [Synechocystis sp. PCC 7509]